MTITLPEEWRGKLENAAKRSGYATVDEYILSLAEDAEEDTEFLANLPGPPQLTPRNREELLRMLDEGMASGPAVIADAAFWEERKRILREKLANRKGVSE